MILRETHGVSEGIPMVQYWGGRKHREDNKVIEVFINHMPKYNRHTDMNTGELAILTSSRAWSEMTSAPASTGGHDLVMSLEDPTIDGMIWVLHPTMGRLLVSTRHLLPVRPEDDPAGITMCNGGNPQDNMGIPANNGEQSIGWLVLVIPTTESNRRVHCIKPHRLRDPEVDPAAHAPARCGPPPRPSRHRQVRGSLLGLKG